jgi:hypothetical protein
MPETNQSIDINAPISDVWVKLNNFHDFSWAPNVITSVEKVGDIDGGQVGAKRILNNAFHETLVEIDNNSHLLLTSVLFYDVRKQVILKYDYYQCVY